MTTADKGSFSSADLEVVRNRLSHALSSPQNIASMPRVCAQIAELSERPRTDAIQLVRIIRPILRAANSPAMRLQAAAGSLHQAVS